MSTTITSFFSVVERCDFNAGYRVNAAADVLARVSLASKTVLGRENVDYIDAVVNHYVECMAIADHACVVREKRYTLIFQQWQIVGCFCRTDNDRVGNSCRMYAVVGFELCSSGFLSGTCRQA